MAKRRDADESGELIGPTAVQQDATPYPGMAKMDGMEERGGSELSLEEILMLYSQPINEEQAWAVCYQCCINLSQGHRRNSGPAAGASVVDTAKRIEGPQDVRIQKDGAVKLQYEGCDGRYNNYVMMFLQSVHDFFQSFFHFSNTLVILPVPRMRKSVIIFYLCRN